MCGGGRLDSGGVGAGHHQLGVKNFVSDDRLN